MTSSAVYTNAKLSMKVIVTIGWNIVKRFNYGLDGDYTEAEALELADIYIDGFNDGITFDVSQSTAKIGLPATHKFPNQSTTT